MDYEGHWKDLPLKIETFLAPSMATSKASAILGPKSWKIILYGPSEKRVRTQFYVHEAFKEQKNHKKNKKTP